MITRARSLHALDFLVLRIHQPTMRAQMVEKILIRGLRHFLDVAQNELELQPPLHVTVGLEGVKNFELRHEFVLGYDSVGKILIDRIEDKFDVDAYGVETGLVLLPFFKKVMSRIFCKKVLTMLPSVVAGMGGA